MTSVVQKSKLAQAYDLDPAHSQAEFAVKHMMIANVRGRIPIVRGSIVRSATGYDVEAELDAAGIDTGAKQRDDHLRSGDFFDAATHPTLRFTATGIAEDADAVDGELVIRGITKHVRLEVERTGEGVDPWGNRRVALLATTTLDRHQWGLNWNAALEAGGVLVGDKVKVTLDLQAVERKS